MKYYHLRFTDGHNEAVICQWTRLLLFLPLVCKEPWHRSLHQTPPRCSTTLLPHTSSPFLFQKLAPGLLLHLTETQDWAHREGAQPCQLLQCLSERLAACRASPGSLEHRALSVLSFCLTYLDIKVNEENLNISL